MGIDAVTFGGSATQAAPRMVADLRPTADAAALARDPRAAGASATPPVAAPPATQPATLSQLAEVSRSMIGQRVGAVTEPQRVLKPWGVAMLPSDPAPRGEADRRATAERGDPVARDDGRAAVANGPQDARETAASREGERTHTDRDKDSDDRRDGDRKDDRPAR